MRRTLPFLPKEVIADKAKGLLSAYAREHGNALVPPIPVEDLLECHLKLTLGFDNLQTRFGSPDVLGAIWIRRREVLIDERLDPTENQGAEGRYRFTVAHEIGHWELHRELFEDYGQMSLSDGVTEAPSLICRKSEAKAPIEWQADRFAAELLMPAEMVRAEWLRTLKTPEPLVYDDHKDGPYGRRADSRGFVSIGTVMRRTLEEPHSFFFEAVAREFAPIFAVSVQAMRIRLEDLRLLRAERELTLFD